jgi:hypothetical protein
MAQCQWCEQDMPSVDGCTVTFFDDFLEQGPTQRLKYGEEGAPPPNERCRDCECLVGHYHHPGCCIEVCPVCKEQAMSCDCPKVNEAV